jgi:hypothetical protein
MPNGHCSGGATRKRSKNKVVPAASAPSPGAQTASTQNVVPPSTQTAATNDVVHAPSPSTQTVSTEVTTPPMQNTSIHGNKELPTTDARTPTKENINFDADIAMNNSSPPRQNSPASSSIALSSIDIELLQMQNENGLFFRPD